MLLWRYMSVETWQLFTSDRRLGVTRLAGFDDAFECMVPMAASVQRIGSDDATQDLEELFNAVAKERRRWASCWFADEHESIAMWELHVGKRAAGVAVAVLHDDLSAALPQEARIAPVHYVRPNDTSAEIVLDRPDLWPFVKLWGFRHEREVRIVLPDGHPDVEPTGRDDPWGRLNSIELPRLVRHARVFAPNSRDELALRSEVEAWAPESRIEPSLAYPLIYHGEWRYGMTPDENWASRMLGIVPVEREIT